MAKTTYTQRSLAELRKRGFRAEVVERWMPFTGKVDGSTDADGRKTGGGYRRDLFKFIDIIAITPDGILAVQSTSHAQLGAHRRKIVHTDEIRDAVAAWAVAGAMFKLWGWRKVGNRWQVTEQEVDVAELARAKQVAIEEGWRKAGKLVQTSLSL